MPRRVSSPFQNFGSRLTLALRPTPNAVKIINIGLHLQLPGRRSNHWAKCLGMPVLCLCLDMSYSNFINLAQGLHNWWDPLQMWCHFSKHTIWATLLVSGPRSNPSAKLLEMLGYLIQLSKLWLCLLLNFSSTSTSHIGCHHCGQTLTIDHMLLECALLQECCDEYYTVDSLNALFETIPETCIIEFLREAGFFYLIWCNLLTSTSPQYWAIWSDLSYCFENESNSETHSLV